MKCVDEIYEFFFIFFLFNSNYFLNMFAFQFGLCTPVSKGPIKFPEMHEMHARLHVHTYVNALMCLGI